MSNAAKLATRRGPSADKHLGDAYLHSARVNVAALLRFAPSAGRRRSGPAQRDSPAQTPGRWRVRHVVRARVVTVGPDALGCRVKQIALGARSLHRRGPRDAGATRARVPAPRQQRVPARRRQRVAAPDYDPRHAGSPGAGQRHALPQGARRSSRRTTATAAPAPPNPPTEMGRRARAAAALTEGTRPRWTYAPRPRRGGAAGAPAPPGAGVGSETRWASAR